MKTVSVIYHPQDSVIARYVARMLKRRGFSVNGAALTPAFTAETVATQLHSQTPLIILLTPAAAAMTELQWLYVYASQGQANVVPMMISPLEGTTPFDKWHMVDATTNRQAAIAELMKRLNRTPIAPATPSISRQYLIGIGGGVAAVLLMILLGVLAFTASPNDTIDALPTRFVSNTSVAIGGDDPDARIATEAVTEDPGGLPDIPTIIGVETEETALATEDVQDNETEAVIATEDDLLLFEDELIADFLVDPIEGPAPHTITIENISSGPIETYAWDFESDGTIDSTDETPPPFTYTEPGDYEIILVVTDVEGNESEWVDYVYVLEDDDSLAAAGEDDNGLEAFFTMDPYFGDAPLTVNFTDESVGDIVSYEWDFNGDGAVDSTAQNPPSYTYEERGEYTITLTVVDRTGETDTMTDTITISDSVPPDVFFSVLPGYGFAPLTVSFTNNSSGEITGYEWDFNNDGSVDSTERVPSGYTYNDPGEYEVKLTVRGPGGKNTDSYFISVDTPEEPFVFMIPEPDFGPAPLTVTFTLEEYGVIDTYEWDLDGDGATDSTSKTPPDYTYTEPGSYDVSLTVTGPGGSYTDELTVDVEEVEAPLADFDISPGFGTAPLTVSFIDYSFGTIDTYEWDFDGDGTIDSNDQNPPDYTYGEPGDYEVMLRVSGGGLSDEMTQTLTVDPVDPPLLILNASAYVGTAPLTVTFTHTTDGEITGYAWDFDGAGTTDSTIENPPPYTYDTVGEYTAKLTVSGPGGTDTDEIDITVQEPDTTAEPAALMVTLTNVNNDIDGSGDVTSTDVVTYTATINNTGGTTANGVQYTAPVPQHTTYIANSTTLNGNPAPDITAGAVNIGSIATRGTATVTYRVRINLPVPEGVTNITTQGTVSGQGIDTVLTDDPDDSTPDSPTTFAVRRTLPALSATLVGLLGDVDFSGGLTANDVIDYIVTVENNGNGPSTTTRLVITAPDGTQYIPGSTFINGEQATDITDGPVLLNTLRPGQRRVVSFQVRASSDLTGITAVSVQGAILANPNINILTDNPITPEQGDATVIDVQVVVAEPSETASPATTEEVTATTPPPPVETEEPVVTTPPPVETEEPTATTPPPPVETEEPVVTTPPPVDTEEPTPPPPVDTEEPVVTTPPPVNTEEPTPPPPPEDSNDDDDSDDEGDEDNVVEDVESSQPASPATEEAAS
ncbi:MAG: PKD domain-containing protein [Chloroflexota bacterium]